MKYLQSKPKQNRFLDAVFSCFRKKKVEMPTCNTSYWKENLVVLNAFFSLSSISYIFLFLLLIILYKLCRKSFLYILRDHFYFKASSWTQVLWFPMKIKKLYEKKKEFIYFILFRNYWKWIKIVEDKMHIFLQFLLIKGLKRSFKRCCIIAFKFIWKLDKKENNNKWWKACREVIYQTWNYIRSGFYTNLILKYLKVR